MCFTLGCAFSTQGLKVCIVNQSEELTFRDFKKAEKPGSYLNIKVGFVVSSDEKILAKEGITYYSSMAFSKLLSEIEQIILCASLMRLIQSSFKKIMDSSK